MAQKKRKSIYDNISLEGLDKIFEPATVKDPEAQIVEEKTKTATPSTLTKKLKLKNSKRAIQNFVDRLPFELEPHSFTCFENISTKKLKPKNKVKELLREVVKIIVVQEEKVEKIALLEQKEETIVDVIEEKEESTKTKDGLRYLEDQLFEAHCKIERLNQKEEELNRIINSLKEKENEDKEEILWLKSQQDIIARKLSKIETNWWWKFRCWFTGN